MLLEPSVPQAHLDARKANAMRVVPRWADMVDMKNMFRYSGGDWRTFDLVAPSHRLYGMCVDRFLRLHEGNLPTTLDDAIIVPSFAGVAAAINGHGAKLLRIQPSVRYRETQHTAHGQFGDGLPDLCTTATPWAKQSAWAGVAQGMGMMIARSFYPSGVALLVEESTWDIAALVASSCPDAVGEISCHKIGSPYDPSDSESEGQ